MLGLGIDTGGTYTDAVVMNLAEGEVVTKAKALTTRQDLCLGIKNSIESLRNVNLHQIELVAASTTLATNSIVEGKMPRVGLILIGFDLKYPVDRELLRKHNLLTSQQKLKENITIISGRFDTNGEEIEPLDLESAKNAILEIKDKVKAFAVAGNCSIFNPAHELTVKRLIGLLSALPAVCGHQLTGKLGMYQRAVTALLNAQLIPMIQGLVVSLQSVLREKKIKAPLMIVRSDSSLMSAGMATERPIETILSGPAASVLGARSLTQLDNGIIVDMGGTTTDIAVLRNGRPYLNQDGALIGKWQTRVLSIDVKTSGIGGDSYIRTFVDGTFRIGPTRVIPLCLASTEYPDIREQLNYVFKKKEITSLIQCTDFLAMGNGSDKLSLQDSEKRILEVLSNGPRSLLKLSDELRLVHPYLLRWERLEKLGIINRISLTPTDILHAEGSFQLWDTEAASIGADIAARKLNLDRKSFTKMVKNELTKRLSLEVLKKLITDKIGNYSAPECRVCQLLIENSLNEHKEDEITCKIRVSRSIIGIGAPAATYLPSVGKVLGTKVIIPPHAEVANAIGAIVAGIIQTVEVTIGKTAEGEYIVVLPEERRKLRDLEEAVQLATKVGKETAYEKAIRAGAKNIHLRVERKDKYGSVANGWGKDIYLETKITITGTGIAAMTCPPRIGPVSMLDSMI